MTIITADPEQAAEMLLAIIRKKPGQYFEPDRLMNRLSLDRDLLDEAVALLASWDYKLRLRQRKGVCFVSAPDSLTDIEIQHHLRTKEIGRVVHAYNSLKSTNDLAAQMAESGSPEGTLIVAETQTRGRGRLGRVWYSPPGTGIYLSIILRPTFPPESAPGLSVMTALALAETINEYCPGETYLKWPNDVLIGRRKTAGILTELSADRGKINHVIVGVGINVNQGVGHFPEEIRGQATSVRRATKRKVRRVDLLVAFLKQFEKEYSVYQIAGLKKACPRLKKFSSLLGKEVAVRSGRTRTNGLATDIDASGRLILETKAGKVTISAGEVTIVKD